MLRRYDYTHDQLYYTIYYHFLGFFFWGGAKFKFAPGRQLPSLRHWGGGANCNALSEVKYIKILLLIL